MKTKLNSLCRHFIAVIAIIFIGFTQTKAQYSKFEFGATIGPSNFLGDLGGNAGKGGFFLKDNMISLTRFMSGAYVGYRPFEFINFNLHVNYGRLEGADSLIKGNGGLEEARKARNQHFRSNVTEAYLSAEIYPTALMEYDAEDVYHRLRPYGVIGIGVFRFNPKAQYVAPDGSTEWVALKPLRTEGQGMSKYPERKEYSLTQMNIPYGVGLKYFVTNNVALSFEIINRKTFTDYIDDVSTNYIDNNDLYAFFGQSSKQAEIAAQMANKTAFANGGAYRAGYSIGSKRGNANNNDAYYATNIKLTIRLGGYHSDGGFGNWRSSTKCPVIRF